ncbi:GMC family oxidoreductase N-terminal domain-containing protein [Gammaproteobacteria bacterium]|nr:GMC family oxidoreductase N-terminal domain-containing protein [Gammaproteobacteria bacterium]
MKNYDFIILGAGSAGCVLANRLSANPNFTVCLIEAGSKDTDMRLHVPLGFAFLGEGSKYSWNYNTEPQKEFEKVILTEPASSVVDSTGELHEVEAQSEEHRRGYQPRGKTLGGSSSINAMLYVRGHKWDYDHWSELGNDGWSFDEVLPYFKKAEHNEVFDNEFHGKNGPLNVSKIRHKNKSVDDFVKTGSSIFGFNEDFNGESQEGVGYYQTTQKDGKRCSAAKAYLVPILDRENLTILTDTNVDKIIIEDGRASGVLCINEEGEKFEVNAKKEVLLSSGAFGSPQILLRSGIGPREEIVKHGIEHKVDLPGVGKNLQDHIDYLSVHKHKSINLIGFSLGTIFLKFPYEILKYILTRTGLFTSTVAEAGGFIRSRNDISIPDIQLHFAPGMVVDHGRQQLWGTGISCHTCLLRPKSRGEVTLKSADPFEDPKIDPKFLSHPDDMKDMIEGYKKMMKIMNKEPLSKYTSKHVYRPIDLDDDDDIEQAIREEADTVYHPVGTCMMGKDEMAVVNNKLKVYKLDGLRVVDSSIMPTLIGGNTNAPTIMIAEKASDLIIEDWS